MVFFSMVLAAVGLIGFAALSMGFYQRELQRNLERELETITGQAGPAILRLISQRGGPIADRLSARLLARLEQFGAVYAVRTESDRWVFGPEWPTKKTGTLNRAVEELPFSVFDSRNRPIREGGPPDPRSGRPNVRILPKNDPVDGWTVAGVKSVDGVALFGFSEEKVRGPMGELVSVLLLAAPIALGLVAAGAWFLSSRAMRPIHRLTEVAGEVTAEDLGKRIATEGVEREFRELIDVFNSMLGRLEQSFSQAKRFGQDAAHELNTPLTVLTGKVEEALASAEDGSSEQNAMGELADEIARLRDIVRKLHLLARIDGGALHPDNEGFDFVELTKEVVSEMREVFPEIRFSLIAEGPLHLEADRSLTRQVLLNLTNNAGRYNRSGGKVTVTIKRDRKGVHLTVENTGSPIPERAIDGIFDRFTRADPTRGSKEGLGLGLSLSREFARIQGGDLKLVSSDASGTTFELWLPL